jgi:hypothetical protein
MAPKLTNAKTGAAWSSRWLKNRSASSLTRESAVCGSSGRWLPWSFTDDQPIFGPSQAYQRSHPGGIPEPA